MNNWNDMSRLKRSNGSYNCHYQQEWDDEDEDDDDNDFMCYPNCSYYRECNEKPKNKKSGGYVTAAAAAASAAAGAFIPKGIKNKQNRNKNVKFSKYWCNLVSEDHENDHNKNGCDNSHSHHDKDQHHSHEHHYGHGHCNEYESEKNWKKFGGGKALGGIYGGREHFHKMFTGAGNKNNYDRNGLVKNAPEKSGIIGKLQEIISNLREKPKIKDTLLITKEPFGTSFCIKGDKWTEKNPKVLVCDKNENIKEFDDLKGDKKEKCLADALKSGQVYICYCAENLDLREEQGENAESVLLKAVIKDLLIEYLDNIFEREGAQYCAKLIAAGLLRSNVLKFY